MNILIIEDDKLTLNLLQYSVGRLGHNAFVAEDGEAAISLLENTNPDLIICDVMMPGVSGLSLVTTIRSVHKSRVPIIMMSALNNKPLLDSAFEAGADDFLAKPFTMDDLEEKLRKFNPTTEKIIK